MHLDPARACRFTTSTSTSSPNFAASPIPSTCSASGEYAVAEWTTHARTRDGRCYDSDYVGVFRVVDGHLAEVTEYLDTAYAKQVLFNS